MARALKPRGRASSSRRPPGSVRIIGGIWRGRRLTVPPHPDLRPTPDRVRETIFNWLQPWLPGARCLDLFAGTGALGLEALSRGASEVVLIEQGTNIVASLRENISQLQAQTARLIQTDALHYLAQGLGIVSAFDIVFVDPPFRSHLLPECLGSLAHGQWIKPGGLVYIESAKAGPGWTLPQSWELLRNKTAGQVGYHLARTYI